MAHTLEDIKKFINKFVELEYQFGIGFYDSSLSKEQWKELVNQLESFYGNRFCYYAIINTTRDESRMTAERLENKKKNLKKRRLFLIRKYENPIFGKGIINADPGVMWSCFLGSNVEMGAEIYPNNESVGIVDGELKIISERKLDSEKRRSKEVIEWIYRKDSNVYEEDIIIKKDGKLVETLRVVEPQHPTWIADYNS